MPNVLQKALHFLTALLDVYREEDRRQLEAFSPLALEGEDMTEDITALLLAMHTFCEEVTGFDGDLIDFTHVLNKLTFQHLMEVKERGELD